MDLDFSHVSMPIGLPWQIVAVVISSQLLTCIGYRENDTYPSSENDYLSCIPCISIMVGFFFFDVGREPLCRNLVVLVNHEHVE